jgi:serine/threonine protein kinase
VARFTFDSSVIIDQYRLGKTLGAGATGKVKLATHMPTGVESAIKIIKKSEFTVRPDLIAIGYRSADNVREELSAPTHTQAKNFDRMWAHASGIEVFSWQSVEVETGFEDDFFMQAPVAVAPASGVVDEFGRRNRLGQERFQSPARVRSGPRPSMRRR